MGYSYGLDVSVLPAYLVAVALICVAPGPDMAYMTAVGISAGRRAATKAGLGVTVGVLVYVIAVAAGLGRAIGSNHELVIAIQVIGALYLVWLAWSTLSGRHQAAVPQVPLPAKERWFVRGVVVNLTNPKAALFLLALLPQFIGNAPNPAAQLLMLGLTFQLIGLIVDLAVGWAAGTVRQHVLASPRILTAMSWASAAVFCIIAAVVATDAAGALATAG